MPTSGPAPRAQASSDSRPHPRAGAIRTGGPASAWDADAAGPRATCRMVRLGIVVRAGAGAAGGLRDGGADLLVCEGRVPLELGEDRVAFGDGQVARRVHADLDHAALDAPLPPARELLVDEQHVQ